MSTILDQIVATKRQEIAAARGRLPETELQAAAVDAPTTRDFFGALAADGPIKLIAEGKRASPSAGIIRSDFDPVQIAKTYQTHGATCISILTDEPYFQGKLEYLTAVVGLRRRDMSPEQQAVMGAAAKYYGLRCGGFLIAIVTVEARRASNHVEKHQDPPRLPSSVFSATTAG